MHPLVSIIMGSDSDLPIMQDAAKVIDQFKIPYEVSIVSAHRTPKRLFTYAQNAAKRNIQVIIAGAGGSAHLPGMVASLTPIPVIGVPILTKSMQGIDSLLSIVQMPPGIPVATVAINGAKNAGLLAISMLAMQNAALQKKVVLFKKTMQKDVENKATKLEKMQYARYLDEYTKNRHS